jgi:hypothetical protein
MDKVRLTAAQARALQSVADGKVERVYRANGNILRGPSHSRFYWQLDSILPQISSTTISATTCRRSTLARQQNITPPACRGMSGMGERIANDFADLLAGRLKMRCAICSAEQGQCDCWTKCPTPRCTWSYRKGESCPNCKRALERLKQKVKASRPSPRGER